MIITLSFLVGAIFFIFSLLGITHHQRYTNWGMFGVSLVVMFCSFMAIGYAFSQLLQGAN